MADIHGVYFEIKRRQRFDLYGSMHKATEDAGGEGVPVVLQRRNQERWVAVCWLDDLPELARLLTERRGTAPPGLIGDSAAQTGATP